VHIVRRRWLLSMLAMVILFLSGCSGPDHVTTVNSPTPGVFFTVETSYRHGPISSDYTRIYAHLMRNGDKDRKLVLSGEYLEGTRIIWVDPGDVVLCMPEGDTFTDSFHNVVTLIAGNVSETIRNHLREDCKSGLPVPSKGS
jgi:hypothetical protein